MSKKKYTKFQDASRVILPLKTNEDVRLARSYRALEISHKKIMADIEGTKAKYNQAKIQMDRNPWAGRVAVPKKKIKKATIKKTVGRVYKRDSKGRFA